MPDFTKAFRWYANKRYAKIQRQNPSEIQEKNLLSLIAAAQNTFFGKEHNFSQIKSVKDFQKEVPLRNYENFWKDYWKDYYPRIENRTWPGTIPYFCLSSGTTSGTTKYIPYTHEMIKSNSKAGLDIMVYHLMNRPASRLFGGKSFVLGGSTELESPSPGIYAGDLSGIAAMTLPWWARSFYFPPKNLLSIKNWEEKINILSSKALKEDIRSLSGVPSWLILLIQKMSEIKGEEELKDIFPKLELLIHGGVNFAPYFSRFTKLLEGGHAELREVYPASEGFFAISDKSYNEGLRLNLDHFIFFEFIPLEELSSQNPTRHWINNIETNINYAIAVTTAAGLWSYIVGDTVRFIETNPPRLLVTGRTSYFLSAFGEHLAGEEVEKAVSIAAETIKSSVTDYSLGALYPDSKNQLGGHLLIVEFAEDQFSSGQNIDFQKTFERTLCRLNEDYRAHFADGFGLRSPVIRRVKPGTFAAWMKKRGKLGGQHKVPRIISNQELFTDLIDFTNSDT